jgi:hypothetical protein
MGGASELQSNQDFEKQSLFIWPRTVTLLVAAVAVSGRLPVSNSLPFSDEFSSTSAKLVSFAKSKTSSDLPNQACWIPVAHSLAGCAGHAILLEA